MPDDPKKKRSRLRRMLRGLPGGGFLDALLSLRERGAESYAARKIERDKEALRADQPTIGRPAFTPEAAAAVAMDAPPKTPALQTAHQLLFDMTPEQRTAILGTAKHLMKHNMVPKNYDEAARVLDAMTSLDRDKLMDAPALLPELMASLTIIPGAIQALRDVATDVQEDNVGLLTALAGIGGAAPFIGPIMRAGKMSKNAVETLQAVARANPDGFSFDPRLGKLLEGGTPDAGIMVGLGPNMVIDIEDTKRINQFLRGAKNSLGKEGNYAGGWLRFNKDTKKWELVLDVSKRHTGPNALENALKDAGTRERALFNMENYEEIANPNFVENVNVTHRSPRPSLKGDVVNPEYAGSGKIVAGKERAREGSGKGLRKAYFSTDNPESVEHAFKDLNVYEGTIPNARVYDLETDPLGVASHHLNRPPSGRAWYQGTNSDNLEKALRRLGYTAMRNEKGVIASFVPVKVTPAQAKALGYGALGTGAAAAAFTDDDLKDMDAAGLILMATGGAVDPRFLKLASRTAREAQAIARDVEAAGGVVLETRKLRANQLMKFLTDDEKELLEVGKQAEKFAETAKQLNAPEELINVAAAGRGNIGGYQRTAKWLVDTFGEDAPVMTGLLAATSPRTRVARNAERALEAFDAWVRLGRPRTAKGAKAVFKAIDGKLPAYEKNIARVLTAETPEAMLDLSGPKVRSFTRNLSGDLNPVTNDTWMGVLHGINAHVMGRGPRVGGLKHAGGPYLAATAVTRAAGEQFPGRRLLPAEIQEAMWAGVRGEGVQDARTAWDFPGILEPQLVERKLWQRGGLLGENIGADAQWPGLIDLRPDQAALRRLREARGISPNAAALDEGLLP